jgi:regulator of CtrA degradation
MGGLRRGEDMEPSKSFTDTVFFLKSYDEVIALLYEARNYFAYAYSGELSGLSEQTAQNYNREALRLTHHLTHAMTWLLVQRAVHTSEISANDAKKEELRLAGFHEEPGDKIELAVGMSLRLRSRLERFHALFRRIFRFDELVMRDTS